jgi:hypothetical protein
MLCARYEDQIEIVPKLISYAAPFVAALMLIPAVKSGVPYDAIIRARDHVVSR